MPIPFPNRACPTPGLTALKPGSQTAIPRDAPWQFKEAGGWERERSADLLRRVVTLSPERPLPYGCSGDLVVPEAVDGEQPGKQSRWGIETYGKLELTGADCRGQKFCPNGPFVLTFSTPVKGAELLKRLSVLPKVDFSIADTGDVSERWVIAAQLRPRTGYLVRVDSTLKDTFGQPMTGYPVKAFGTTGYRPDVSYRQGKSLVERMGRRTFGISYVNVDTLEVLTIPVPDSLEGRFLSRSEYGWGDQWKALAGRAVRRRIPLGAARDRLSLYGYDLPAPDASKPGSPTLFLLRATSPRLRTPDTSRPTWFPGSASGPSPGWVDRSALRALSMPPEFPALSAASASISRASIPVTMGTGLTRVGNSNWLTCGVPPSKPGLPVSSVGTRGSRAPTKSIPPPVPGATVHRLMKFTNPQIPFDTAPVTSLWNVV